MTSSDGLLFDASALVELVIEGRHRDGAERILDRIARDPDLHLISAAHGLIEATSVLRRFARINLITEPDGARAVVWLRDLDLTLDPTGPRLDRVWELRHAMTSCDAAYAAAADALSLPLISADKKLIRACGAAGIPAVHLDDALPGAADA